MGKITQICSNEPRYIISMDLYDGTFEMGANSHYTLDTPLDWAIKDFLDEYKKYDNGRWYQDKEKSELEIRIIDCEIKDLRLYLPST